MKKSCVGIFALFLVFLATAIFAATPDQGPAGSGNPGNFQGQREFHHGMGPYFNFSKEQKDKMRDLRDRFLTDSHNLRYDILQKRLEVRKLFTDPKVDDATLLAKQKELNTLKQKLMEMRAQMKVEWRRILTPEQIQKLDRMPMRQGMHPSRMRFRAMG